LKQWTAPRAAGRAAVKEEAAKVRLGQGQIKLRLFPSQNYGAAHNKPAPPGVFFIEKFSSTLDLLRSPEGFFLVSVVVLAGEGRLKCKPTINQLPLKHFKYNVLKVLTESEQFTMIILLFLSDYYVYLFQTGDRLGGLFSAQSLF
jgi:hypothetical protein